MTETFLVDFKIFLNYNIVSMITIKEVAMNTKKHIGLEIKVLSNLLKRKVYSYLPPLDAELTDSERQVIGFLYKNQGKDIFQKDVEEKFVIRRSTASRMLKTLEEKNFIVREPVKGDARLKKVSLTPMAQDLQKIVIDRLDDFEEMLSRGISEEEMDIFFMIAEKVKKNLEDVQ